MAIDITITVENKVNAEELFDQFYDLDCTENCEGEYEPDVNAWTCEVHRPDLTLVYALFHTQQPTLDKPAA